MHIERGLIMKFIITNDDSATIAEIRITKYMKIICGTALGIVAILKCGVIGLGILVGAAVLCFLIKYVDIV